MSKLKFGWAEQSITPDKKVSLAGQFAERISEYVEKPICVTALAISSETDQAIFCACDLVDISWGLRDAVRAKLAGNDAGLDPMKVIISATHVHTGPRYAHRDDSSSKFTGNATSFRALIESELPPDKKYIESANISANPDIAQPEETFEFLAEQISKAALAAWTSRTEGSFVNAFGRAPVGMCRRVCYNDGSAQMWGNAETAKFTAVEGGNDFRHRASVHLRRGRRADRRRGEPRVPGAVRPAPAVRLPRLLGRGQDAPAQAFRRQALYASALLARRRPVPGRSRPLGRAGKRRERPEPQAHQPAPQKGRPLYV